MRGRCLPSLYWPTWSPTAGARESLTASVAHAAWEGLARDLPSAAFTAPTEEAPPQATVDYWTYRDASLNAFYDSARLPQPETPPAYALRPPAATAFKARGLIDVGPMLLGARAGGARHSRRRCDSRAPVASLQSGRSMMHTGASSTGGPKIVPGASIGDHGAGSKYP